MTNTRRSMTLERLEKAFSRLRSGTVRNGSRIKRVSITAVAKEAGVTPALVHNRYPEFAAKIRAHVGLER